MKFQNGNDTTRHACVKANLLVTGGQLTRLHTTTINDFLDASSFLTGAIRAGLYLGSRSWNHLSQFTVFVYSKVRYMVTCGHDLFQFYSSCCSNSWSQIACISNTSQCFWRRSVRSNEGISWFVYACPEILTRLGTSRGS